MARVFRNTTYKLSSPYGYRIHPISGARKMHWGEDYSTGGKSLTMYSPIHGKVVKVSYDSARGKYIDLKCKVGIVRLQHCKTIFVKVGQLVSPYTKVAITGSTGASTGVHLHIEYRTLAYLHISPDKWLAKYSDSAIVYSGKLPDNTVNSDKGTSTDIKKWQMFLNWYGLDVKVTGKFDADTIEKTKIFQKEHGLDNDGSVGELTRGVAEKVKR